MAAKGKNLHFFRGARPKGIPMAARRIAIVGAGPGGLSAAMILAYRGYDVTVFEKEAEPGGRNRPHRVGP
jgi:NADPH-dependent glutamate synthase beta subunit-like oxidoreductase